MRTALNLVTAANQALDQADRLIAKGEGRFAYTWVEVADDAIDRLVEISNPPASLVRDLRDRAAGAALGALSFAKSAA